MSTNETPTETTGSLATGAAWRPEAPPLTFRLTQMQAEEAFAEWLHRRGLLAVQNISHVSFALAGRWSKTGAVMVVVRPA